MNYIEAPDNSWLENIVSNVHDKSLFLGGSITGSWDWQANVCSVLKNEDITILNPRRKVWDSSINNYEQIKWEYLHLKNASAVIFWFSHETLAPITMFEYGKFIETNKKLFVGCHPNYARLEDVRIQTLLSRQEQVVHTNIIKLTEEILKWINLEK